MLAGRRILSVRSDLRQGFFSWDALANVPYWQIVQDHLHHRTSPRRSSLPRLKHLAYRAAYRVLTTTSPSSLILQIPFLNASVVMQLLNIIGLHWGLDPNFPRSIDDINLILAHLLAFSIPSSSGDGIRLDLFSHSELFRVQPPFNDRFVREFSCLCSQAGAKISHLSLRSCKRISAVDGIAFLLQSQCEHLVTIDLSHSQVTDEAIVLFLLNRPPLLESLNLHSTIISVETLIALHRYKTAPKQSGASRLKSIDLRNCQQLFFEEAAELGEEYSLQKVEKERLLLKLINEMRSLNVEINTSSN